MSTQEITIKEPLSLDERDAFLKMAQSNRFHNSDPVKAAVKKLAQMVEENPKSLVKL